VKPSGAIAEGDDYIVQWDPINFGFHFSRLRETDSAIRALVTPVQLQTRDRILAPSWVSLFTMADRDRLAKAMHERVSSPDDPDSKDRLKDWRDSVEEAFTAVIDLHTREEPLDDLATYEPPPDDGALIGPSILLRNQINVLLADQKSGKSYDALLLAVSVSTGRADLLPRPFTLNGPGGPVIYYDAETDKTAQRRRLERVCAGLHLPQLPPIHYRRLSPPLVDRAGLIRGDIARTGAVLVIIDSLTYAAGGELNSLDVSVPTMNAIGELGANVTKLLTSHHGKGARKPGERPSMIGSAGFEFKARNIWTLRKDDVRGEDSLVQAWEHSHINDGRNERGFGLRLEFNDTNTAVRFCSLAVDDSAFVAQHGGTHADKIRAALLNTEFLKADTKTLAKLTGLDERVVRRSAETIEDVRRVGDASGGRGNVAVYEMMNATRPVNGTPNGRHLDLVRGWNGAPD
jgi:hypothetical protein